MLGSVINPSTLALIEQRLGRRPRGLREVAVQDSAGDPMVIRVASIVDGKPFPTLFWLIDPELCLRIDRAEARGVIATLQALVDASPELQRCMRDDHGAHIALRRGFFSQEELAMAQRPGFRAAFRERGIGGIADFRRIRCLHTWYAAHLVNPNTVGRLLDQYWAQEAASADSSTH